MTNDDLFKLYDSDLVLRLHNAKNLSDTRKILARFRNYLNGYPPSPELAKGFLAQYTDRAPRTLYRYTQMLRVFMKWYGQPLDGIAIAHSLMAKPKLLLMDEPSLGLAPLMVSELAPVIKDINERGLAFFW